MGGLANVQMAFAKSLLCLLSSAERRALGLLAISLRFLTQQTLWEGAGLCSVQQNQDHEKAGRETHMLNKESTSKTGKSNFCLGRCTGSQCN